MAFRTLRATTRTACFYTQRARAFSSSSPCLYPPSRSNGNDDERLTTAKAGDTPGTPAPAAPAFGFSALCLPSLTTPVTVGKVTVGKGILATSPAAAVSPLLAKFLMVAPPLAAQVVFLAPMGAMRTFKKEKTTGAVSPINLAAMCVNGIVWISYGAMRSDPTIWAPNITAFLFGSYYLYTFNQYKAKGVSMTPSLAGVAAASLATGGVIASFDPATAGDIIGHAGIGIVAVMFGGPLLSLKTVLKDKATKSIPFAFCIASFVNCICWTSYGYLIIDDYIVWLPNLIGLGFSTAQLALHAKFGIDSEKIEE